MERLPGYIWSSNRYYRVPPEGSSSFVNLPTTSDPNAGKQDELEKKIAQTHSALSDLEYGAQTKSGPAKFNAYDSLLASRFTSDVFKFNRNIFIENLLNFRGARLADPVCQHLAALPARDLLVGVWKNESSCTVSQIDVKGLLVPSSTSYRLVSSNNIGNFQNFVIDQIQVRSETDNPTEGPDLIYLFCLMRSYDEGQEKSRLQIWNLTDLGHAVLDNEAISMCIEFTLPYYSVDVYQNTKLVMGGEGKVYLFGLGKRNRQIFIRDNKFLRTKEKSPINCVKFNANGTRFCIGTNRGSLEVFNCERGESQVLRLNHGSIVDLAWLNENELIVSAHNHNLLRVDLRCLRRTRQPFEGHVNSCKRLKFSIDYQFNTLTCCGQDNCIRIWSLASGNLIRLFDFGDLCSRVSSKKFTENFLLHPDQLAGGPVVPEWTAARQRPSTLPSASGAQSAVSIHPPKVSCLKHYARPANEQYQVVNSSQWDCLKKKSKVLMFGAISDSVDLFY